MIRMLKGQAASIHLGPPGFEGEGIEFSVDTAAGIEYHQVKRQLTGKGVWSLTELSSRGVLSHFAEKLKDPKSSCVFISSHAAHPLDQLACRAKKASSWENFEQHFISSETWRIHFNNLHKLWSSPSREDTYDRLKRITVDTIKEGLLRESIENSLEALVVGNPSNVLSALLDFASNQLHQNIKAADIWNFLQSRDFVAQVWSRDLYVSDLVTELNQTYLSGMQPVGIGEDIIPRIEVDSVLEAFDVQSIRTVMVSGKAGVGKSSVIFQILQRIDDRDWPMLLVRVDRLEPSPTPHQLGISLGLPASPVSVLAALAEGRDCLLVIDQVDAVSQASGRNPEFFDCISAMLRQAKEHDNMRVLSACRKFDIDNDPRIRDLTKEGGIAKEVSVELFSEETVKEQLVKLGIDPSMFGIKQIQLLRLPLHLRLLSEIAPDNTRTLDGLQTAKDLFDRFWDYKLAIMRPIVKSSDVIAVVDCMVHNMTERQSLAVSAGLLDDYKEIVSVMVSENVLVKDGQRISFYHESFFDYMFARRVTTTVFDLVSYITEHEQSLFIRSQVRQVLLHQRDVSIQDFCYSVQTVLMSQTIRSHVKTIVLSLLGSVEDPTEEEWDVVRPFLTSSLANHFWVTIHGSSGWFDLLDNLDIIHSWLLDNNEATVNRAVWLLNSIQEARPDRTAELLSPFVGVSESWDTRLTNMVLQGNPVTSRPLFDLVLHLVRVGAIDGLMSSANGSDHFWIPVQNTLKGHSDWMCELIAIYIRRLITIAETNGKANTLLAMVNAHMAGEKIIDKVADAVPSTFVDVMLPPMLSIMEMTVDQCDLPPWRDRVWENSIYNSKATLASRLLSGLESSLAWIAANEPEHFRSVALTLQESPFRTAQTILLSSYATGGEAFADEAIEYLLANMQALVSTSEADSANKAIFAATPHCSSDNFANLERAILNHTPEWERGSDARTLRGISQFRLLANMDAARLSQNAVRRLQELRRKFGDSAPSLRTEIQSGTRCIRLCLAVICGSI